MSKSSLSRQLLLLSILSIETVACGESNNAGDTNVGPTNSVSGQGGSSAGRTAGSSGLLSSAVTGRGAEAMGGTAGRSGGSTDKGRGGTPASVKTPVAGSSNTHAGAPGFGGTGAVGVKPTIGGNGGNGGATTQGGDTGAGGGSSGSGVIAAGGGTSVAGATLVPDPSWACGMPEGIPDPTLGELVFRATLDVGATHDVGTTQYGHRRLLDVTGGKLSGDRVQATVLTGGLDLELTLSNGAIELEQINILRTSDGAYIYMRNCGVASAGDPFVRVVADFEVPNSNSLAWLNTGKYVGTRVVDPATNKLQLDVYDVSKLTATATKIQLKDPAGVPQAPWDCSTTTGSKGTTVFTENVTLGSSISVGASKRGTRNIIPITGGTTTGKVAGKILSGGADYQLIGSGAKLDARYTLAPSDGEFIVVRNCGPMGALIPTFEARADGPYAFLNANTFISSDPGGGSGGVSITFYERK